MEEEKPVEEPKKQSEQPQEIPPEILPFDLRPQKPVVSDTELAKDLLKVHGKTAVEKVLVQRVDEKDKVLGYDVKEAPNTFFEILTEDVTKSNLTPKWAAVITGLGTLVNYTQSVSKELNIDLTPTQKLLVDNYLLICTVSRGKGGWNAWLSKTDKTITQTSMEQLSKQLAEEKKSRWKFW